MTTAPAEPRVSDDERHVLDQMAHDLETDRATIASQAEALAAMKAENERLADFEPDYHRSRAELMTHYEARIAAEAALKAAREALGKCKGYMLNAVIDLETGTPKATTKNTLNGGIRMIDEAIARAHTP